MLNRITLIGRLTSDPELRHTPGGNAVCTVRIAVNRDYDKDAADFIDIVTWRKSAEYIKQYGKKGRLVSVDGRLQIRNWQDKDGKKRTFPEVIADRVSFLDKVEVPKAEVEPAEFEEIDDYDDLPF